MPTRADIQLIRSLADKRARTETGLFVAEGAKLVGEICRSPLRIRRIYTSADTLQHPAAEHVSPKDMERLSLLKTPSDTVALVEIPRYDFALSDGLVLALDEVQNPGNMGTIIRLADWYGISDVICSPDCADCFNPKVVQATMGAILRVRVHYLDLPAVLAEARRRKIAIYGTFLEGEDIYRSELTAGGIVVMGNEGRGVSPEVASLITRKLLIPPYPASRRGSESLNVAVATAVVCSEFRRRM